MAIVHNMTRDDRLPEGTMTFGEILVLGIGNILRKDDGVGIAVIDRLRDMQLPARVRLLDGGTAGIDLLGYLEGVTRLIVVDALLTDKVPGEITVLSGDDVRERDLILSGHYGRLSDILDMVGALWSRPETMIVGVSPKDCESYEMALSPEVAAAVEKAAKLIKTMVETRDA